MQYRKALILAAAVFAAPMVASAAPYFQDSLEDPSTSVNYNVNAVTANSPVVFGFDYSGLGIPLAPGEATTHALELRSNVNSAAAAVQGVTVATKNFVTNTSYYKISAYVWINSPAVARWRHRLYSVFRLAWEVMVQQRTGAEAPQQEAGPAFGLPLTEKVASPPPARQFATIPRCAAAVPSPLTLSLTQQPIPVAMLLPLRQHKTMPIRITPPISQGSMRRRSTAVFSKPIRMPSAPPEQSGTTANGSQAFAWHLWTVERNNSLITWSIDGHEISELTSTPTTLTLDGAVALSDLMPRRV